MILPCAISGRRPNSANTLSNCLLIRMMWRRISAASLMRVIWANTKRNCPPTDCSAASITWHARICRCDSAESCSKYLCADKPPSLSPHWPVDRTVDRMFESLMTLAIQSRNNEPVPFIWFWPDGAQAALILTHDVEAEGGKKFCSTLMDLDDEFGFT